MCQLPAGCSNWITCLFPSTSQKHNEEFKSCLDKLLPGFSGSGNPDECVLSRSLHHLESSYDKYVKLRGDATWVTSDTISAAVKGLGAPSSKANKGFETAVEIRQGVTFADQYAFADQEFPEQKSGTDMVVRASVVPDEESCKQEALLVLQKKCLECVSKAKAHQSTTRKLLGKSIGAGATKLADTQEKSIKAFRNTETKQLDKAAKGNPKAKRRQCVKEETYRTGAKLHIKNPKKWHLPCDAQVALGNWSDSLRKWEGNADSCILKKRVRTRVASALDAFKKSAPECAGSISFDMTIDERDYGKFVEGEAKGAVEEGVLNPESKKKSSECACPHSAPIITEAECRSFAKSLGKTFVGFAGKKPAGGIQIPFCSTCADKMAKKNADDLKTHLQLIAKESLKGCYLYTGSSVKLKGTKKTDGATDNYMPGVYFNPKGTGIKAEKDLLICKRYRELPQGCPSPTQAATSTRASATRTLLGRQQLKNQGKSPQPQPLPKGPAGCPSPTKRTGKEKIPVVTIVMKQNPDKPKCAALAYPCSLVGTILMSGSARSKERELTLSTDAIKSLSNVPARYCRTFSNPQMKELGVSRRLLGAVGSKSISNTGNFLCADDGSSSSKPGSHFVVGRAGEAFCQEQEVFRSFPRHQKEAYKVSTGTEYVAAISGPEIACIGTEKSGTSIVVPKSCAPPPPKTTNDLREGDFWGGRRRTAAPPPAPPPADVCATAKEKELTTARYLTEITCCKRGEDDTAADLISKLNKSVASFRTLSAETEVFTHSDAPATHTSRKMCAALRTAVDPHIRETVADMRFEIIHPNCASDSPTEC